VRERHGHAVRRVRGPGRVLQSQQPRDHAAHLRFGGAARADNGLLDGGGGVLGNREPCLCGREEDDAGRRFFQRLIGVSGVGPKIAIALMSALGVERGARAVKERNIALLGSVSGIGKKTAERLALELADKLGDFEEAVAVGVAPGGGAAEAALHALERLGYATAEADRALRQALAANGGGDAEMLVRQALQLLTHG